MSNISSPTTNVSPSVDVGSLAHVPASSNASSSLRSCVRSSSHPYPTMVPLPESPAPSVHSFVPSPSLSLSTPQTDRPSIHSGLETRPREHTHPERSETLRHEFDRLLHHIRELNRVRGQEIRDIAENVRIIREELHDLSVYVRTHLVATERVTVAERTELAAFSRSPDRSVSATGTDISESTAAPVEPRSRPGSSPTAPTPPPIGSPSISPTSSWTSLLSYHPSDRRRL